MDVLSLEQFIDDPGNVFVTNVILLLLKHIFLKKKSSVSVLTDAIRPVWGCGLLS